MAEAMRHRSVFSPRSSNRTCGFTASGSPTGFTSRHTVDCQFGLVSRDDTVARNQLSPCGRAPSEASGYFQVLQAHRQSPILGSFESVPEVRVLSSAGITRPHRSYDPVRLPPGPPCSPRRWRCDLRPERASPDYPDHLSNVPCPIPRWIGTGAYVGCFPIPRGLPRFPGGSASTISLSRPAQTSLALRPAGSLNRPRRPLSRGFETAGYPTAPLVSYQINRQLSGWYLPPLVIRAFGAHWEIPAQRHRHSPNSYLLAATRALRSQISCPSSAYCSNNRDGRCVPSPSGPSGASTQSDDSGTGVVMCGRPIRCKGKSG